MKTTNTPLLQMTDISKAFPGVQALDAVDLSVYPSSVHALIGENGAGKSTLIKILSGALQADVGRIILRGHEVTFHNPREAIRQGIATINQELMLVPELSVAENILLGRLPHKNLGKVDWQTMRELARQALSMLGLDLDLDTAVGSLSVAEQQAAEIARALSRQAEIIVMDEPTSALAGREIDNLMNCIERLRKQGKTIILITHKLDEVFRAADRITVLRDGKHIDTVLTQNTHPDQVVNMMVGRSVESVFVRQDSNIGEPILQVRNLSRQGAFDNISFTLRRGEVLGFSGLIGAGRTELMRAIFGADPFDSGEIWIGENHVTSPNLNKMIASGVGLVPEDRKRHGLVLGMTVGDNLVLTALNRLARWGLRNKAQERAIAHTQVADLSIKTPSLRTEAITLSGGNQQKVVIGKWLAVHPRILVLDEPTRGIDIGAKAEVHLLIQNLARQGVGIILVSSELVEVMNVSDRILVMHEGHITGEFLYGQATEEQIMACATGQSVSAVEP